MIGRWLKFFVVVALVAGPGFHAWAGDLRITLPKRSVMTPVQRLNRQGVDFVRKHQYEKAEGLFLKAYLYDPADPFTLNNLGYIAELEGDLDRAQKFYDLASKQSSNADIDLSNAEELEGKPMRYAVDNLAGVQMRVNSMNVEAMELLSQGRSFESEALLKQTLSLDPENLFTLNNLGVADEAIGDYQDALKYYDAAADSHSPEPVVVTQKDAWRGKPVSEMAADSARRLEKRIEGMSTAETRAVMLAFRGVSAANQNNWPAAREDFLEAYALDPESGFSLNNRGYVAERDGDLETAQFFYDKARNAYDANARVGVATQRSAEGKHIAAVAADSDLMVDGELKNYSEARHRQTGPIELTPRGNPPAGSSSVPPEKPSSSGTASPSSPSPAPQSPQ